jgi:hypothetical protein
MEVMVAVQSGTLFRALSYFALVRVRVHRVTSIAVYEGSTGAATRPIRVVPCGLNSQLFQGAVVPGSNR